MMRHEEKNQKNPARIVQIIEKERKQLRGRG